MHAFSTYTALDGLRALSAIIPSRESRFVAPRYDFLFFVVVNVLECAQASVHSGRLDFNFLFRGVCADTLPQGRA